MLGRKMQIKLDRKQGGKPRKLKFAKSPPERVEIDYDTTDEMGDLMIPAFLQHSYINNTPPITNVRDWQREVLASESWEQRKNSVVLAPTSGGKTLIAEVAIAQLLEDDPTAQAIYALPFVALASEKSIDFQTRFAQYNVRSFFQNVGGREFSSGSIGICTYEKAHSILNTAIQRHNDKRIKLVIVDEAHMIGDESRGVVCESLLMKLRVMQRPPRIITLTATLNDEDAQRLAVCIGGCLYKSIQREIELARFIATADGKIHRVRKQKLETLHITQNSIKEDPNCVLPLARSVAGRSLIVFVNTRRETEQIAIFLTSHFNDVIERVPKAVVADDATVEKRRQLIRELAKCPAGLDGRLAKCMQCGIAFHNAGLLLEERKIVEEGMRSGAISTVVATTTLSAGINIRSVSRVIIHSPFRGYGENRALIPAAQIAQMSGRSGRTSRGPGDVFFLAKNERERDQIFQMLSDPLPPMRKNVIAPDQIASYILQALSLGLASDIFSLRTFLSSSFDGSDLVEVADRAIKLLHDSGMAENYVVSKLGHAVSAANLTVAEGVALDALATKLMQAVCLDDDLHLMFMCTPEDTGIHLPKFSDPIWEELFKTHEHVIRLITGKTQEDLRRLVIISCRGQTCIDDSELSVFSRIYCACILCQIVMETPLSDVQKLFNTDRGTIQTLQSSAASSASQASRFSELMGYCSLSAAISSFIRRLSFGVRAELIELMTIPSMRRDIARTLYDRGFKSAIDLATLSSRELAAMMPRTSQGPTEEYFRDISKQIIDEADALSEQLAILEDLEEQSTWNAITDNNIHWIKNTI